MIMMVFSHQFVIAYGSIIQNSNRFWNRVEIWNWTANEKRRKRNGFMCGVDSKLRKIYCKLLKTESGKKMNATQIKCGRIYIYILYHILYIVQCTVNGKRRIGWNGLHIKKWIHSVKQSWDTLYVYHICWIIATAFSFSSSK